MLMSICMVLTANAELGKLNVIGDCNSWNTSQSEIVLTETEEGSKIFVGENISLNAGYFTILQNLGDSWVDVNATRIGPSNPDEMIAKSIGTKINFADPYSSWQKGAIENVNGLIRQYIPKNTCFSNISQQQITKIMQKINTRPREKLNFSTPNECFYKKML